MNAKYKYEIGDKLVVMRNTGRFTKSFDKYIGTIAPVVAREMRGTFSNWPHYYLNVDGEKIIWAESELEPVPSMITPNTKYRFTKGVVLSDKDFFVKGFEFKTGKNSELEEGKFNDSFPREVLEIWAEDGTIEDMNVFKPKIGEYFFYLPTNSYCLAGTSTIDYKLVFSESYKNYPNNGNAFRTVDDANECAEMIKNLMKNFYSIKGAQN